MTEPRKPDAEPPSSEERLLEHNYDGIQEYDNPLPRWWVGMFWATIVFSIVYYLNVIPGIGTGRGRIVDYEKEVAAANAKTAALEAAAPKVELSDAVVWGYTKQPAAMAGGKETFATICATCHRPDGGGNIGPNLTDDYWIHGNQPMQLVHTITTGVADKGMPPWEGVLTTEQIGHVAAYVLTLRGTHPPAPKARQGDKLEPAAAPAP
jgi:cytochrome c oxidase cbb3-type subunit 3